MTFTEREYFQIKTIRRYLELYTRIRSVNVAKFLLEKGSYSGKDL